MYFTAQLGHPRATPGQFLLGSATSVIVTAGNNLALIDGASTDVDFVTVFDQVIAPLGLSDDSQGNTALIHALLQYAARHSRRGDRFTNPFREVLYRLEQSHINPHALSYLKLFFNTAIDAYDRR